MSEPYFSFNARLPEPHYRILRSVSRTRKALGLCDASMNAVLLEAIEEIGPELDEWVKKQRPKLKRIEEANLKKVLNLA